MRTSARQVARKTPFFHCAAAAGVWYVATVTAYAVGALKSGAELWPGIRGGVLMGLVAWVLSALLLWLAGRRRPIQPWLLIPLALPFYGAMWLGTNLTVIAWALLFFV